MKKAEPKKCRSCGAMVLWATMVDSRKPGIFDATPIDTGTFELKHINGSDGVFAEFVPREARGEGEKLYQSHFATCPQSNLWRAAS